MSDGSSSRYWSRASIASVVRKLIDAARSLRPNGTRDPLIRYLVHESPADGGHVSTVENIDLDLYR